LSPPALSRLKRMAIEARPLTRPDSVASRTFPVTSEPAGTTVIPSTTIAFASVARTASSALLLSDATPVASFRLSDVPDGMVTSRNSGSAGGGDEGAAGPPVAPAAAGVEAGVAADAPPAAAGCEEAAAGAARLLAVPFAGCPAAGA